MVVRVVKINVGLFNSESFQLNGFQCVVYLLYFLESRLKSKEYIHEKSDMDYVKI